MSVIKGKITEKELDPNFSNSLVKQKEVKEILSNDKIKKIVLTEKAPTVDTAEDKTLYLVVES